MSIIQSIHTFLIVFNDASKQRIDLQKPRRKENESIILSEIKRNKILPITANIIAAMHILQRDAQIEAF